MSLIWIADTQSIIYTKVKKRVDDKLKSKYSDLHFTKDSESTTPTKFPTVYVQEMPYIERWADLERNDVNCITIGMQIDVTVSKQQGIAVAKEVIYEVLTEFKRLGFDIFYSPRQMKTGDETKKYTTTVNRKISKDDYI